MFSKVLLGGQSSSPCLHRVETNFGLFVDGCFFPNYNLTPVLDVLDLHPGMIHCVFEKARNKSVFYQYCL